MKTPTPKHNDRSQAKRDQLAAMSFSELSDGMKKHPAKFAGGMNSPVTSEPVEHTHSELKHEFERRIGSILDDLLD